MGSGTWGVVASREQVVGFLLPTIHSPLPKRYCCSMITTSAARRFSARPSAVLLSAFGRSSP